MLRKRKTKTQEVTVPQERPFGLAIRLRGGPYHGRAVVTKFPAVTYIVSGPAGTHQYAALWTEEEGLHAAYKEAAQDPGNGPDLRVGAGEGSEPSPAEPV